MNNIYETISNAIIAELEKGVVPWQSGLDTSGCSIVSHRTGRQYSFLNQMLLHGKAGEYLTFHECKAEGGFVKKGEHAKLITFYKMQVCRETDEETGEEEVTKMYPVLRGYNVFDVSQCEGIDYKFHRERENVSELNPIDEAEKLKDEYIEREGVKLVQEECSVPCYVPMSDTLHIPLMNQYDNEPRYYGTLFHEIGHSTGHKSRLDRNVMNRFGSDKYAREELVAEITSSYILGHLGIKDEIPNSASYISSWMKHIKENSKFFPIAMAQAEKACKYILNED